MPHGRILLLAVVVSLAFWIGGSLLSRGALPESLTHGLMSTSIGNHLLQRWLSLDAPPSPAGTRVLDIGDQGEDLDLVDLQGRSRALSTWHGRRVLLNFWATWCQPCRKEMPLLDAAQKAAGDHAQILGIAMDRAASVRAYIERRPVGYPILLPNSQAGEDPTRIFGDVRGVLPYSVLLDRDGRILDRHIGALDRATLRDWLRIDPVPSPPQS